ncbi:hypothetical protein J6590_092772 [Homalodisca vitripennis]|nr:hypothetical protein J6590_092772 [Homalodisca vitripennis]
MVQELRGLEVFIISPKKSENFSEVVVLGQHMDMCGFTVTEPGPHRHGRFTCRARCGIPHKTRARLKNHQTPLDEQIGITQFKFQTSSRQIGGRT